MAVTLPWGWSPDMLPTGNGGYRMAAGDGAFYSVATPSNTDNQVVSQNGKLWLGLEKTYGLATLELPTGLSMITVGWRGYYPAFDGGTGFLQLVNASGAVIARIHYTASGTMVLQCGTGTTLATITDVPANTELYYELSIVIDDAAGSYVWRVHGLSGMTERTGTGVDTRGATGDIAALKWGGIGYYSGDRGLIRDVYVKERLVGDPQLYGPLVARWLKLTADVTKQWTPLSGTDNWDMLDDPSGCDGASSYNSTTTLGHRDVFTAENLPATVDSIVLVSVVGLGHAPEGGMPLVKFGCKDGANEALGTARYLGLSGYAMQMNCFSLAPDGGVWSPAKVDSAQVVVEAA